MELREFISEVLTDIFEGVSAAQKRISDKGGEINPFVKTGTSGITYAPVERTPNKTLCIAEFDVALTVADKEQKGGKIGVLLGNIGIGCGKSKAVEASQLTRIKFSVPYRLP